MSTFDIILIVIFSLLFIAFLGWCYYDIFVKGKSNKPKENPAEQPTNEPKEEPKPVDPTPVEPSEPEKPTIPPIDEPPVDEPIDDGLDHDGSEDEPINEPINEPTPIEEPVEDEDDVYIDNHLTTYLKSFDGIVDIIEDSQTYKYLHSLVEECLRQSVSSSAHNLPLLYNKENFPNIVDYYGKDIDLDGATDAMCGWVIAMALSELVPSKKDEIFTAGYNLGGDKDTPVYKYDFYSDRNIARLVASAIFAAMRGKMSNDEIKTMRSELGGSMSKYTIKKYADDSYKQNKDEFFIDLSKFMPTAPGPYLSNYKDRSVVGGEPYPSLSPGKGKTDELNLEQDQVIYDYVINNFNLEDNNTFYQRTVQAIADKEGNAMHLFGKSRGVGIYTFDPVFGIHNIGVEIEPLGDIGNFLGDVQTIGQMARHPLMDGKYYGRRRPGQTKTDGRSKNGKDGVLCNFDIENNDGCPGSYNRQGVWVEGKEIKTGEYCEYSRNSVYANSYPSGHSSGIWCLALSLIEIMPEKADLIMRAANTFAVNRTIARYHWNSDTIIGRVLGSAINAVAHTATDYIERFDKAKEEYQKMI